MHSDMRALYTYIHDIYDMLNKFHHILHTAHEFRYIAFIQAQLVLAIRLLRFQRLLHRLQIASQVSVVRHQVQSRSQFVATLPQMAELAKGCSALHQALRPGAQIGRTRGHQQIERGRGVRDLCKSVLSNQS